MHFGAMVDVPAPLSEVRTSGTPPGGWLWNNTPRAPVLTNQTRVKLFFFVRVLQKKKKEKIFEYLNLHKIIQLIIIYYNI